MGKLQSLVGDHHKANKRYITVHIIQVGKLRFGPSAKWLVRTDS